MRKKNDDYKVSRIPKIEGFKRSVGELRAYAGSSYVNSQKNNRKGLLKSLK